MFTNCVYLLKPIFSGLLSFYRRVNNNFAFTLLPAQWIANVFNRRFSENGNMNIDKIYFKTIVFLSPGNIFHWTAMFNKYRSVTGNLFFKLGTISFTNSRQYKSLQGWVGVGEVT